MIGRRRTAPNRHMRAELHRLQADVVDDAAWLIEADADHPWWEHLGLDPAAAAAEILRSLIAATQALTAPAADVIENPGGPGPLPPTELLAIYEALAGTDPADAHALLTLVGLTARASGRLEQLLEL